MQVLHSTNAPYPSLWQTLHPSYLPSSDILILLLLLPLFIAFPFIPFSPLHPHSFPIPSPPTLKPLTTSPQPSYFFCPPIFTSPLPHALTPVTRFFLPSHHPSLQQKKQSICQYFRDSIPRILFLFFFLLVLMRSVAVRFSHSRRYVYFFFLTLSFLFVFSVVNLSARRFPTVYGIFLCYRNIK